NAASLTAFADAREHLPEKLTLIVGNHDRRMRSMGAELGYREQEPPYNHGGLTLCHDPCEAAAGLALAGHVHPLVRVQELRLSTRLKCFAQLRDVLILPAYGDFTGGALIEPPKAERIYAIAGREVVPLKG
ncbi:MAG: DEAD/DEAH box helicase, partial [Fimbriimonadaceae bacterium]